MTATDVYEGPPRLAASVRIRPPGDIPTVVSAAIQSHLRRAEMAAALAETVGSAEVVSDPDPDGDPSPWRTYRETLERTPVGATHRLILQDDALPCPGFRAAVEAAIRTRPEVPLVLFVAGQPFEYVRAMRRASDRGEHWAWLDNRYWLPCVAVAWPTALIGDLLAYVDAQNWPRTFRSDDEILGRFLRARRVRALATVPSLVQ